MKKYRVLWNGRIGAVAGGIFAVLAGTAVAYNRYNDGCDTCHGSFTGSTTTKGTIFPSNNKHKMHNDAAYMATQCDLCHTSGDGRDPYIGSSTGRPGIPGVGCTGCHGQDFGGTVGVSGAGLRKHHAASGVTICAACHPGDPTPLPESVKPPYYGTADTKCDDPCNSPPGYKENWSIGDTVGLDNDGDDIYDTLDPDCSVEGDMDLDGDVDLTDYTLFAACLDGPGDMVPPAGCTSASFARADLDGDHDVDVADAGWFQVAF